MIYSRIASKGSARYEALKRRNDAVRALLGMGSKSASPAEQPAEQKKEETPSE
jgi:hypothetical protein